MSILCRIGLHSWKPVFKPTVARDCFGAFGLFKEQVACQCRRCGKRVVI